MRMQASASLVIDGLGHVRWKLLLVLEGPKRVQDDGSRSGAFGHIEDDSLRAFVQRITAGLLPGLAVQVTTCLELNDLDVEWQGAQHRCLYQ
jgi:hypothetical protein